MIFYSHQIDSYHYSLTLVSVYDTSVDLSGPWPGDAITVITLLPSLDDIFIVLRLCFVSKNCFQFAELEMEELLCIELCLLVQEHVFVRC